MNFLKTTCLPVFLAAVWISFSEFLRNELLFKSYWMNHYKELGVVFPSQPINGIIWGVWSLMLAVFIFILSRRFKLLQTTLISWFAGFVMMWVVAGNLGVLPFRLLLFAVPLSFLEAFLAGLIIFKLKRIKA